MLAKKNVNEENNSFLFFFLFIVINILWKSFFNMAEICHEFQSLFLIEYVVGVGLERNI
jgi:hypothetical protein